MPTGYTAAIKDGISFEDFAMRCARGMGALIMMRDEPMNAPVPHEFKPGRYHSDELNKLLAKRERIKLMSAEDCSVAASEDHRRSVGYIKERTDEADALCASYQSMLHQVRGWEPPTADHEGLKRFMVEQIESSLRFDSPSYRDSEPELLGGEEWRKRESGQVEKDIAYHEDEHAKEVERTNQRNSWVAALRASLEATRG